MNDSKNNEVLDDLVELLNYYIDLSASEGRSSNHIVDPLVQKYGLKKNVTSSGYGMETKIIR